MYQTIDSISDSELREVFQKRFTRPSGEQLKSPRESADHLRSVFADYPTDQEHFAVVYLDGQNKIITTEVIASGTINMASIYPRVLLKRILELQAVSVLISHTHPSGLTDPSSSDRALTKKLQSGLALFDIDIIDHLIIGIDFLSFSDQGLL
jgi:DNA repair protein RadC